jgi:deferrochelatase/peroxidase EfeB
MKPGMLRRFTLRFAFWVVGQLATRFFLPGHLGSLGTINFARWVTVPKTGDLLFMSNYGGSWESYLEDFITKAHAGLTGIWSNTVGYPKTSNLFEEGATDGERFKHWARRQQIPTAFWYSAYPASTTSNIRTNALIRQGLGAAMTEDEARSWLTLFGSEVRPVSALEANEIQSLVFGGLGFMNEGMALLFGLSDDHAKSKSWLAELLPQIRFSDGRTWPDATVLGLAASALPKLGLPDDSMATFPAAFVDGMAAPWRARALGDVGTSAPTEWDWGGKDSDGKDKERIDGVLLMYAHTRDELDKLQQSAEAALRTRGHAVRQIVRFQKLPSPEETKAQPALKREPFGFADGISQPIIRGTYKALRGADPIHLVEAGEFIFGYPDNRGYMPPSPTLAAIHDPANLLPVVGKPVSDFSGNVVNNDRDIGRNGTFLAIRQLEQHVDKFWAYCESEGKRLKDAFPPGVSAEPKQFVAAKIVGRWPDGSPLVRYPRYPATDAQVPAHPLSRAGAGVAASVDAVAPQIPAAPTPALRLQKHFAVLAATETKTAQSTAAAAHVHGKSGTAKAGATFDADNDFLFGTEDPQGMHCPFGAHIRRANPRDSLHPGSDEQVSISNRHRIIRIGRFYEPDPGRERGLFFMCLNGDITRQFEFVQQTWIQSPSFQDLSGERDPLIAGRDDATGVYTIPETKGPMRLKDLPSFVRTRGGGYFFLPGRRTIEYLASN